MAVPLPDPSRRSLVISLGGSGNTVAVVTGGGKAASHPVVWKQGRLLFEAFDNKKRLKAWLQP